MVDYTCHSAPEAHHWRLSPAMYSAHERPPTPDPRHAHRQSPPRQRRELYEQPVPRQMASKHVRKRPTAIYLGSSDGGSEAPAWSFGSGGGGSAEVPLLPHVDGAHFTTSLRQHLPKTPSPRFPPSSPSLSSSCTTVQSSPTLTPVGVHDSAIGGFRQGFRGGQVSESWQQQRELKLRRAKRLPHSDDQCAWEVHAVVNVGNGSGSGNGDQLQSPHLRQEASSPGIRQCAEGATAPPSAHTTYPQQLDDPQAPDPAAEVKPLFAHHRKRSGRAVHFHGVSSESASREGSLRVTQKEDTSTYSLSKYRFPAPPGHEWSGDIGYLDSPTRAQVHYRGASFDVVNPHASLLLGPSDFETPGEIDGLLDDYFQQSSMTTPSATFFGDMSSARQNLRPTEGARNSATRYLQRDPHRFDDARHQALPVFAATHEEQVQSVARPEEEVISTRPNIHEGGLADTQREGESLNEILGLYGQMTTDTNAHPRQLEQGMDDTASNASSTSQFYEDMRIARAESPEGTPVLIAYADRMARLAASQASSNEPAASPYTRGMARQDGTSDLPTSERTYGDTRVLLGLPNPFADPIDAPGPYGGAEPALMRPTPMRNNTEVSIVDVPQGARSSRASLEGFEDLPLEHQVNPDTSTASLPFSEIPRGTGKASRFLEDLQDQDVIRDDSWQTMDSQDPPPSVDDPRPSVESYANTSYCGDENRFSAPSYADRVPPVPQSPSEGTIRSVNNIYLIREAADIFAIAEYLLIQCKNKVITQDLDKHLVEIAPNQTSHEERQAGRVAVRSMQPLRDSIKQAKRSCAHHGVPWLRISNDAGLEAVRQKKPDAHRRAVEYIESAYEVAQTPRKETGAAQDRGRGRLTRGRNTQGEDDERHLLASPAPIEGTDDSEFQWRDSTHTMHTQRQVRRSTSIIAGRVGLDIERQEDATSPIQPPARVARTNIRNNASNAIEVELQDMSSVPRTPSRFRAVGSRLRAAISDQTAIRPLNLTGSPTSNINDAFTERDLHQASRRFHTLREAPTPLPNGPLSPMRALRYSTMAVQAAEANPPTLRPRGWVRSSWVRARQEKISTRYYWVSVTNPITCYMFSRGKMDYLMKLHCFGEDVGMTEARKKDAGQWFFAVSMAWMLMFLAGVMAIAFVLIKGTVAE